jgi:hypothetical protein
LTHLVVRVKLYGAVVEERVVPVLREVRLGEADDAVVSFPGADLLVRRHGRRLKIRGRYLTEGACWSLWFGAVGVELETLQPRLFPTIPSDLPDMRFLVAVGAVALIGAFADSVQSFATTNPEVAEQLAGLFDPIPDEAGPRAAQMVIEGEEPLIVEGDPPVPGVDTDVRVDTPPVVFTP